jgi:hypothetical protein
MYVARRCTDLVAHIQNTNSQYNLPAFSKKLSRKYNHDGVAERFEDPAVRKSVEVDLAIIQALNPILKQLEWYIEKSAREHDYHTLYLLRSIPGAGLSNKKIGNPYLKWAIKEAAVLMLRDCQLAKDHKVRLERKYNPGKALGIFSHKPGRAIYCMLKNKEAFDMKRFFAQ